MKSAYHGGERETGWVRLFSPRREASLRPGVLALNVTIVTLALSAIVFYCFARLSYHWQWDSIWRYRFKFLNGWFLTLGISFAALTLSLLIGLAAAIARRSRILALRLLATIYVEFIRGTPLLVQILLFFYVIANALGVENRYLVGVLTLSLFSGAYVSEIIRSGIDGIAHSQLDAARAVGFTPFQTYRYVIAPQALRYILPPLAGQFASLIKDSSLLSIIAISEFTLNAQEVNSFTYSTLESYFPLALGYLALTLPISLLSRSLERRAHYEA